MDYSNQRVTDIIAKIGHYLKRELPDDDIEGEHHLVGLEALRFELLEVTVDWKKLVAEKKSQYLHPKETNLTELDRTISLNASLSVIQRDLDFLIGLDKLVTERLELGKTIY